MTATLGKLKARIVERKLDEMSGNPKVYVEMYEIDNPTKILQGMYLRVDFGKTKEETRKSLNARIEQLLKEAARAEKKRQAKPSFDETHLEGIEDISPEYDPESDES